MKLLNHRAHCLVIRCTYFLLIFFIINCLCAKQAHAQGMPMFTNPIGSKQLMKYADRLELTVGQRLALEPMHDSYLQIFRTLRDEDMQEFIDILYGTMSGFVRNGFSIPQRSDMEKIVREYLKIEKKITAIDKSLFNEMESLLDENQHFRLERVRKQRKLDVLRTIILEIGGEFNPGAQIDLTQYVESLDLTNEEKVLVDPILISYESALLARARKLHSAIKNATVTILDALDEMGLRELSPQELIQLGSDEEFQLSIETMFDEASIEFQSATFELSQLNLKTLRKVLIHLELENKYDLRNKYYQRVYGSVLDNAGAWRRKFEDALKLKSLPPELISPIKQTHDSVVQQQDALIEKIVNAVEKSREYRTIDTLNNNNKSPQGHAIDDLQMQSGSMAKRALQELESLLGPELSAELKKEKVDSKNVLQQTTSVVTDSSGRIVNQTELAEGISSHTDRQQKDQHLPDPLSPSEFQQFVSLLNFETEDQFIVDILYQEYRETYDKILFAPLHDETGDDPDVQAKEASTLINEDKIRQQRSDELQSIDNRFFDDLLLIAKSQEQKIVQRRLRLLRTRTIYRELAETYSPSRRDKNTKVDLVHLLLEIHIDGLDVNSLDAALKSYESQILPLLIERLEITKKSSNRMDALQRANQANISPAVNKVMMEKWQELQQMLSRNLAQLSQVSEEHLDQIKGQVPTNVAKKLQYSYNEIVYPGMFRKSKNVDRTLEAALSLPNISDAQRSQLDAIAKTFHSKYMRLAEQGIKLQRQLVDDRSNFSLGFPSREMIMRELGKERLEFERDESCSRAIMLLQLTLRKALQDLEKW